MNRPCRAISAWTLCLAACGGVLRAKPQYECERGADLPGAVCSDGLIGSCSGGVLRISVCGDTTVCEASWQQQGAYKCRPDDALGDSGTTIYAGDELPPSLETLEAATIRVLDAADGDGAISPGELAQLSVALRNTGPTTAHMVSGTLSTAQPGATITHGTIYFGDIESGETACGSSTQSSAGDCDQTEALPQLAVDSSVASDTVIELDLTVSDAQTTTFRLTVGRN